MPATEQISDPSLRPGMDTYSVQERAHLFAAGRPVGQPVPTLRSPSRLARIVGAWCMGVCFPRVLQQLVSAAYLHGWRAAREGLRAGPWRLTEAPHAWERRVLPVRAVLLREQAGIWTAYVVDPTRPARGSQVVLGQVTVDQAQDLADKLLEAWGWTDQPRTN